MKSPGSLASGESAAAQNAVENASAGDETAALQGAWRAKTKKRSNEPK